MHLEYSIFSLRKRLLALIMLVTFVFFALLFRLIYVQSYWASDLLGMAASQWTRALPTTAKRGDILDTNGSVLATSYTTYNIYVRSKNVKNINEVSLYLSGILKMDFDKVFNKISTSLVSEVLIKMQVDEELTKEIVQKNLAGIYISPNMDRYYPYSSVLSKVLGYTTIDGIGQSGLEIYYNKLLTGINGKSLISSDVRGMELGGNLDSYITAIDGLNVNLTIDINIQLILENALKEVMQDHSPNQASAIIMNPKNGEIVAMASLPSLDSNNLPRDDISKLMNLSKNTMITDVYEPGSTFKILTAAAGLEEGAVTLNSTFYDPGYKMVDGQKIRCWRSIGHGSQNFVEGFCNSCNIVFMETALKMGKEKYYEYLNLFGLGQATGVDLFGESGGILMNVSDVKNVDLARNGFGHAIALTPLQLINAVCCAVNGGILYEPHFIKQITSSDGNLIKEFSPTVIRKNVISKETSNKINYMMEEVVSVRGGKESFVEGFRIGGKTGTAQKYANGVVAQGKYISSFVGTYPADNPEYVLLLCVDEPSSGAYYGSVVASPYAKVIFSKIFEYKNIKASSYKPQTYVAVPDVLGKSISEAYSTLYSLGFHFEQMGEEGIVKKQFPSPGTQIYKGGTVVIYLE